MKFKWRCAVPVLALFVGLLGCGGAEIDGGTTPVPADDFFVEAPPAPSSAMPTVQLEGGWLPVSYGSGRGAQLTEALGKIDAVALVLGKGATAVLEDQVVRMVKAASPDTKIVARERSMVDLIMKERGELPQRVTMAPAGIDILGRPYMLPKEHPLNTDWLQKKGALKGAGAMLTVSRVTVDDVTLKRMRGQKQGGCEDALAKLQAGIDDAGTYFSSFQDEMDASLSGSFQHRLSVALPFWRDELSGVAASVGDEDRKCIARFEKMLEEVGHCDSKRCASAPALHLVEGGLVAMAEVGAALPTGCADLLHRNYVEELYELANWSVQDVLAGYGGQWLGELVRLGSFGNLAGEVEKLCRPRHRRIAYAELEAIQDELSQFSGALNSRELEAHWHLAGGQIHVQGIGAARIFAQLKPKGVDPRVQSRSIVQKMQKLDRCDDMGERLIQVALIDVGTSEVQFLGIMFEEEVLCEDMAP